MDGTVLSPPSGGREEEADQGPVIFISAGEPSGDLHGAAVARSLKELNPAVRLVGMGGARMAREGVELVAELDDLAVMGFAEVIRHLPFFLRLRREVFSLLADRGVDLILPIDYPGFNLRLARHAKKIGIPVLYYIAPQVWAWHKSRAKDLARDTDAIATIFPFETEFLAENGANAVFVGHPLLDHHTDGSLLSESAWRDGERIPRDAPVLALFPGSRRQEVDRHLSLLSAVADRLCRENPNLHVRIAAPEHLPASVYGATSHPATVRTRELLRYATAAVVKSGTTTLEAALAMTPFVVIYRMSPISYQIARRLVDVPHIALANLVAEERLVPEFVQDEASVDNVVAAIRPLLSHRDPRRESMVEGFQKVRSALRHGGSADRVAEIALELAQRGRSGVGNA